MMEEDMKHRILVLQGDKSTWVTPSCLNELLDLKSVYPMAPLVVGNTLIGPQVKLTGSYYPVIISLSRVPELSVMSYTEKGITIGAACSLVMVRSILSEVVSQLPEEKGKMFRVLLQQLSGQNIRNEASLGGSILSGSATWELNPILAVGHCTFNLASKDRRRKVTLRQLLFGEPGIASLRPEELLISINIPFTKKWEFVSAFKQIQRWESAVPAVVAAMSVRLKDGTDLILAMNIYYGGSESACLFAKWVSEQLIGRRWNEAMLDEACRLFLGEIPLQDSTFGEMADHERTLAISFIFKFYLQILQELNKNSNSLHKPIYDTLKRNVMLNGKNPINDLQQRISNGFHLNDEDDDLNYSNGGINGETITHQPHMLHTIAEEEIDNEDSQVVEGELFLSLVTSTRHHAKIIAIRSEDALKVPGVVDVITAVDVPRANDKDVFAEHEVHYMGQVVCAVVADTKKHASLGASRVKIEYQDLEPVILSIQDAIKNNSYFELTRKIEQGNIEEAFQNADHILEGEDYIGGQDDSSYPLHTLSVIPRLEENEIEVLIATNDPAPIQAAVASALNIPSDFVICHGEPQRDVGAQNYQTASLAAITAVAAHKTGQIVHSVLEWREEGSISRYQPPFLGKYKVAYKSDGTIIALDVTYYCNAGHRLDESSEVLAVSLLSAQNAYYIPNTRCCVVACKTNSQAKCFCRGCGFPRACMLAEIWVDAVADRCALPPEKVRQINLHGAVSHVAFKRDFDSSNLIKCWNECMQKSLYHERHTAAKESNKQCPWRKKGLSIIPVMFPAGFIEDVLNQASVLVHVSVDGWVLVTPAGNETQEETHTILMQVASRELRIPISHIYISETNTTVSSTTSVTTSSVTSTVYALAVREACQILLQRLHPIIILNPDATWLECVQEAFHLRICLSAAGHYRSTKAMDWCLKEGLESPNFIFGAACSEVELDCRTGNHKCLRTDIVMDVGSSINRTENTEQIKNAFVQSLDIFISEDFKYSLQGSLNGAQCEKPEVVKAPEQLNVTLPMSSPLNLNVSCSPKAIEETSLFFGTSVFFALKDAVLSARKDAGLPGTVSLPIPVRPQHLKIACGSHFIDATQISNPEEHSI
ncbi:hypothetical protein XENTR_v10024374 [Xenopus tropicalis]|uniref:Aldehyde oxidase 2 n=1 Tax=Xenopus tropicalis TaxID=8364 RepID=A0A6I8RQ40_XENTR|nr:aldehyde oxidase 2 [Xenopus tropicalis]XP_031748798.1 aldehyde oxidase 2 [Xenopus tropicalis]KAE8580255.1 hypothetical protein XENTR_v10024374 [Xenopus tropicalis]